MPVQRPPDFRNGHLGELLREGVRFRCQRCGSCCRRPGYVALRAEDIRAASLHLGISEQSFRRRFTLAEGGMRLLKATSRGECPFFEGVCRLHGAKPFQCRSWPFWPENLADAESWERARTFCKGIGRGPRVGEKRIARYLLEWWRSRGDLLGKG